MEQWSVRKLLLTFLLIRKSDQSDASSLLLPLVFFLVSKECPENSRKFLTFFRVEYAASLTLISSLLF